MLPCQHCGKEMKVENNQLGRKKYCSKVCLYAGRELKNTFPPGDQHPGYVDGKAGTGYPPEFKPSLKKRIKARDNHTCQLCGITEAEHKEKVGRGLTVNHVDFDKTNCADNNLNTLCCGCNSRINFDRPRWTAHFQQMMGALHVN